MPSMGSSYSSTSAHYSRMPSHQGFSSGSYPSRSIKQAYPTSYSMGFNDDAVEPYTITSPPCMLPNQDVVSMGSIYNNQDTLRWNPIIQHKVPSGGLLIDQDSPPSYGGLNLPYFNSTSRMSASMPAMASESAAFFPGLTSLAASLPAPTPSGDRILPNPTTGRTQLPNSSATLTHGSLNDTPLLTSYGSGNGLNYKSSAPWGTESIGSSSSQSYSGTISAHPQNVMTVPSTANSTASTVRDSSLTYIPISHSPGAGAGSSTSSLTYNTTNLPTPSTPHSAYTNTNSTTSMFPTSSSNEALLPSHGSSSNLYSYSSDSSARRDSSSDTMDSDGTLVSGHQYTQIPHPQSQHHATFEVLPRGRTSESRPHTAHRTSIASLSHSREF
ncbi:MAG: hypothetical protein M1827_001386 [Pycnora praestabilis]|nr:MAG: hypothetical protein M1827_001386 [Pycnora praestabilis]